MIDKEKNDMRGEYRDSDFNLKPRNQDYLKGTINYFLQNIKTHLGNLVERYDADVQNREYKPIERNPRELFIAKQRKKHREKLEKRVNQFEMYER